MEHVFIINPTAGRTDAGAQLAPRIRAAAAALGMTEQVHIVRTEYAGHARELAEQAVAAGTPVRLYACGGDGTLNEVLQAAAGQAHGALGCVPCGSGNDYVRNFGTADFLDIAAQLEAVPVPLDVMDTGYGASVDICAAGLDAQVAYAIPRYRRIAGGSLSYTCAIVETLFRRIGHRLRITLDGPGGTVLENSYTILTVCNGQYYGGGYRAAPHARMDDGMLEVLLVRKITRPQLVTILGDYKKGLHITPSGGIAPKFEPYLEIYHAKSVDIEVLDGRPLIVTLDGECTPCTDRLHIELRPGALNALLPRAVLAGGTSAVLSQGTAAVSAAGEGN